MLTNDKLKEFYIHEYEKMSRRKLKNSVRSDGYEKKITFFFRTLRNTKASRVGMLTLENYHKQLKNLAYFAYRYKNQKAVNQINDDIIPQLIRLDCAFLLPEEEKTMDEAFLFYAQNEISGAICRSTLGALYRPYRRNSVTKKIIELVPSRPEMEFPEALEMKRHFILHIGPTNSGKTFHALNALKNAKNGVYLGPLRLLALEVYEKMKEYGIPCTMLTGQEKIEDAHSRVVAATIEMLDINQLYDVAVIDEAQMVVDSERGHSWTKAILGMNAKTIHICMSPAAEKVVTDLIEVCQDDYEICRYERKTDLVCETTPFIFPEDVLEGDALIVFSKKAVLDISGRLEENGIASSVIYGSLPPEIRRKQMELFNTKQTRVVVSTDAIGMGLNLPVRRIVFIQTEKFDGVQRRKLAIQEIKQIAGRAGRFGIYDTGYINAMGQAGLAYIQAHFEESEKPIEKVNLGFPQILLDLENPLDEILKAWHSNAPEKPFEKIKIDNILSLYEKAKKHETEIEGFEDKHILYSMVTCPVDINDYHVITQWLTYCKTYSADVSLQHPSLSECGKPGLLQHETYYKELDLYYQFSHRFGKIVDTEWLDKEREDTEFAIMQYLSKGKKNYIATCRYCGRMLPVGWATSRCARCMDTWRRPEKGNLPIYKFVEK